MRPVDPERVAQMDGLMEDLAQLAAVTKDQFSWTLAWYALDLSAAEIALLRAAIQQTYEGNPLEWGLEMAGLPPIQERHKH